MARAVIVTNHAEVYGSASPDHWVIFDVFTNVPGIEPFRPNLF